MAQGNWNGLPFPPPPNAGYPAPAPSPVQQVPVQQGFAPLTYGPPPGAAPVGNPHYQPPPPPVPAGMSPVAPPMPGQSPAPNYGPPGGYAPPQGQAYGPPPGAAPVGNPFAQPGAPSAYPQGGFRQGPPAAVARRFSGEDMVNVKASGARFPFLPVGMHVLRVERTTQTRKQGSFVAEFTVLWTNSTETQVGAKHTWIESFDRYPESALANVKRFVLSALGCDTDEQLIGMQHRPVELYTAVTDSENQLSQVYPANPLKGRDVTCNVSPPGLKRDGTMGKRQRHDYSPVPRTT